VYVCCPDRCWDGVLHDDAATDDDASKGDTVSTTAALEAVAACANVVKLRVCVGTARVLQCVQERHDPCARSIAHSCPRYVDAVANGSGRRER
jgi:hypothetical protein